MQKKLIVAAVAVLSMAGAHAGNNSNNSDVYNTTNNNQTYNQGGQGGYANGGAGGSGIGVGVGIGAGGAGGAGGQGGSVVGSGNSSAIGTGGSVVGSGNSSATGGSVKNDNTNQQGQLQGQLQGQQQGQGQSQSNKSSNRNDNRSNASNQNSNANSGNNAQTNVSVQGDNVSYQAAKIPVATAYAPNIVATALCKFGVSGGGQGMTFGFSVGVSITDDNCMLLEQVRTVSVILGQKEVAQEMMMAVPAYAEAVKRMQGKTSTKAEVTDEGAVKVSTVTYNDQDHIIRSRLGLPPLTK